MKYLVIVFAVMAIGFYLYRSRSSEERTEQLPSEDFDDAMAPSIEDLTEEENEVYAQEALKAQQFCRIAECHLENLDDEYEFNKLNDRLDKAVGIARSIPDQFYSESALGFAIRLAHLAGLKDKEQELRSEIKDPVVMRMIDDLIANRNA